MDSNLAFVIGIMLSAGLLGGLINVAISHPTNWELKECLSPMLTGAAAALLIPLFLNTISSSLLSDLFSAKTSADKYLLFFSFCLLASIFSKKFIQNLSERVLKDVKGNALQAQEAASQATAASEVANDLFKYFSGDRLAYTTDTPTFATIPEGNAPDDPWKGQFGGKSTNNGLNLSATFTQLKGESGKSWCAVKLTVGSNDPHREKLVGHVQFYLHPTFPNNKPIVSVGSDGIAELNIAAWGAFTVGAIADNGNTSLELDLSELPDAPEPFRSL